MKKKIPKVRLWQNKEICTTIYIGRGDCNIEIVASYKVDINDELDVIDPIEKS